jgi:Fe-S-cluster containining protein
MEYWFCKKCGHCCKHQYTPMELYGNEIELFPKEKFIPYIGYGDSKSNVNVLLYKLIGKRCPLYDDEVGCTIYENRPLMCRRFPFNKNPTHFQQHGYGLDNGCKNSPHGKNTKAVSAEYMEGIWPILKKVNDETAYITEKYYTSKLWMYKNFKWRLLTEKKLRKLFNK